MPPDSTDLTNAAYWKSLAVDADQPAAHIVPDLRPVRKPARSESRYEEIERRRGFYPT